MAASPSRVPAHRFVASFRGIRKRKFVVPRSQTAIGLDSKGFNFGENIMAEKQPASFILQAELGLVQKGSQGAHCREDAHYEVQHKKVLFAMQCLNFG